MECNTEEMRIGKFLQQYFEILCMYISVLVIFVIIE